MPSTRVRTVLPSQRIGPSVIELSACIASASLAGGIDTSTDRLLAQETALAEKQCNQRWNGDEGERPNRNAGNGSRESFKKSDRLTPGRLTV